MRYLKLVFKDAKLFLNNKDTKDQYINVLGEKFERKRTDNFIEPITRHQIMNVLQVLLGERPLPSNRKSYHKNRTDLERYVDNSYLKINNIIHSEKIQTKKFLYNSWSKNKSIDYLRLKEFLGAKYNELLSIFSDILKESNLEKKYTCVELFDKVYQVDINNVKLKRFFDETLGITPIKNFLYKSGGDLSSLNQSTNTRRTVNNGIDNMSKISGEILIPLEENDIERIKNGKCTATILDGGLVKIVSLIRESNIDFEDYRKIIDIPNTRYEN